MFIIISRVLVFWRERERERDVEIVQLNISGEGRDHDQIGVVLKYEHSQYNEGDRVKVRNW